MKIVALILLLVCMQIHAESLPSGISFVGLEDGHWRLYLTRTDDSGSVIMTPVDTASEPREPALCLKTDMLVYIAADGSLRKRQLTTGNDEVMAKARPGIGFSQPVFTRDCSSVLVVSMHQGKSVDTEIRQFSTTTHQESAFLNQPGAQFDPHPVGSAGLTYTHVHCVLDCGRPVVKEVWLREGIGGEARRITRDEAVAHHPVPHGEFLYFSSNRDGAFHIWRTDFLGENPQQITQEPGVTDLNPTFADNGKLYFLRTQAASTQLMTLDNGEPKAVRLPATPSRIRDLRAVTP